MIITYKLNHIDVYSNDKYDAMKKTVKHIRTIDFLYASNGINVEGCNPKVRE